MFACLSLCVCVCNEQLTHSLAGLRDRVHLVAFVALALEIPLVVDADLTAGVWIFTFINICGHEIWHKKKIR